MKDKICGIYKTFPITKNGIEGGLRVRGVYKQDQKEYPLITYVTVVYNRINTLQKCMESVWNQDYPNIEYIVIDGGSTDGTRELIEANADKIDYYISQPDNGIYDAMNKGVMLANGSLICFMNSDDQCKPNAASKVADVYQKTGADIICGRRELVSGGKRLYEAQYPRYPIKKSVFRYVQMFHQSTYVTPEVFNTVGYFEEKYTLLADWIWESKSIDAGFKIQFSDEELSRFSYDGASCQGIYKRDEEWEKWAKETFTQLSQKDANFFIYCLDRGRHPLFDLKMLNKVAFKYFDDDDFKQTYYATVLLICREQCTDILDMEKDNEHYLERKMQRYKLNEKEEISNFQELVQWLDSILEEVCDGKISITKYNLEELVEIRRFLNKSFYHLYIHKEQKIDASKLDRLLRIMCYTVSKIVSKSVFFSRRFYITLRAVWYYLFKGKFVEN